MEVKSVSEAVSVTKKLIGSIHLRVDDMDNLDKLRIAYDNLSVIYDVLVGAEKEAAKKAEEMANPPEEEGANA